MARAPEDTRKAGKGNSRNERLAAALRQNLSRRKAQDRARRTEEGRARRAEDIHGAEPGEPSNSAPPGDGKA